MKPNFRQLSQIKMLVQAFEDESRKLALLVMADGHKSQQRQVAQRIHDLYDLRRFYKLSKKGS